MLQHASTFWCCFKGIFQGVLWSPHLPNLWKAARLGRCEWRGPGRIHGHPWPPLIQCARCTKDTQCTKDTTETTTKPPFFRPNELEKHCRFPNLIQLVRNVKTINSYQFWSRHISWRDRVSLHGVTMIRPRRVWWRGKLERQQHCWWVYSWAETAETGKIRPKFSPNIDGLMTGNLPKPWFFVLKIYRD